MQWLRAEVKGPHLHLRVWLDTSRSQTNPKTQAQEPDPLYVKEYRWSAYPTGTDFTTSPPTVTWKGATLNGTTYTDWASYVQAEVILLAQADLATLDPPVTPLPVQGQMFQPV